MSGKIAGRKSAREKLLESKGLPRVEVITDKMSKRWGTGTMVIPAPLEVNELMRTVPRGKLTTINDIRAALARKHGATIGCPITTGIFAWIAALAAEEAAKAGETDITPYWRTLKSGGKINEKYPGGTEYQAARLTEEGHTIEAGMGKGPPRVLDFERHMARL
ncbi:MAG: MGMT family protein [Chloroflexi bacterium]|nr:MGMT family protein [Chloroflexota bacterium]